MTLSTISTIAALFLATTAVLGGAWTAYDYGYELRQEIQDNTKWRVIQTYEALSLVRSKRTLTVVEWEKWCWAGRRLGVFKLCPAR